MKIYRNEYQKYYAILHVCADTTNRYSLMRKANLGYDTMKIVLPLLTEKGLLIQSTNGITTTEKGKQFMNTFTELVKLIA